MIDEGEVLKKAMMNVAMRRFMDELREAVVTGPKIFSDVYGEYLKLLEQQEKPND